MTVKPKRPCRTPRCPGLTSRRDGYCDPCRVSAQQAYDRARGSNTQRGYDGRWRKWKAYVKAAHRLVFCGDRPPSAPQTTDSLCQQQGLLSLGDDVDHIQPITGPDDPRWLDESNVQLLCDRAPNYCHNRKTQRERSDVSGLR